ncbi:hypothetical protein AC579_4522 [Pseudocercospora musae]|uniref:Major facilitator superfamily (MFS) profile domain-containing protein n=1 Tax=Pseudocercospora musae TaxID=113226 RepID=A0A139HZZ0_9PEZI|nr:hypothetical protein AC579_4522 [Pseudocercospora musae]
MANKCRHVGICIWDGHVFVIVMIGPIVGRYATDTADAWKYIYYGGFIAQVFSLIGLYLLYHPSNYPKGVPWKEAISGLDYVGTLLVISGVCLALVGITNTTLRGFGDIRLLGDAVKYEISTLSTTYLPVSPRPRVRTVPFVMAFIVTMFYYGINVI